MSRSRLVHKLLQVMSLHWGKLLKKNLLHLKQILFTVEPILEGLGHAGKQIGSQKINPLCENGEKNMKVYTHTFDCLYTLLS